MSTQPKLNQVTQNASKLFAFKDEKSGSYGYPMAQRNRGMMIRELQDIKDSGAQHIWIKHDVDFALYEIGDYDENVAAILPYENKICVGTLADLLSKPQQ